MPKFVVSGTLIIKRTQNKFVRIVEAASERLAKEKIFSFFGHVYRIPRTRIKIEEVKHGK